MVVSSGGQCDLCYRMVLGLLQDSQTLSFGNLAGSLCSNDCRTPSADFRALSANVLVAFAVSNLAICGLQSGGRLCTFELKIGLIANLLQVQRIPDKIDLEVRCTSQMGL